MNTLLGIPPRQPDVIFRRSGQFDLTARVVRLLDIAPGDVIDIIADDGEFYLYIARHAPSGRYRGRVVRSKPHTRSCHFRGSSSALCRAILRVVGHTDKAELYCGALTTLPGGIPALPIITRME